MTDPNLDIEAIVARIRRDRDESDKFQAEQKKLMAEASKFAAEQLKLSAEQLKLSAEQLKLERDRRYAPVLLVSALTGGITAIVVALVNLLTRTP